MPPLLISVDFLYICRSNPKSAKFMDGTLFSLPLDNSALIFFCVLGMILFAPIIFDKLKIPYIIGLIFAGMIVGQHGLNILAYDASFEIFGNVGLLYLMFIVGLEMNISDFKKNKKAGIVFGILTCIIPLAFGLLISKYQFGVNWTGAVLFATIYASHTLISYPIVSRYGINKSKPVGIAIAGTLITSIVSLLIMAIAVSISGNNNDMLTWIKLIGGIAVYSAGMIIIYPRITRWFFKKYNDQVLQFTFILGLVFAAAFLAELAGMIGIIGAFFAGIILTRYIPSVSPLMSKIEFVGNALFIPYFLIGVGMIINLEAFTTWSSLYTAVIMTIGAIIAKWIPAWITQKSFKLPSSDRKILFGLSNSQAAATLAVALVGFEMGLFNEEILNGVILMILVTCTISALATERAAKEIALLSLSKRGKSTAVNKEEKMLISIPNKQMIDSLIDIALILKRPMRKTPFLLLNVINDTPEEDTESIKYSKDILRTASQKCAAANTLCKTVIRHDLNIAEGIINTVKERNISFIVTGLHNKANIADSFFGNKTESVLKGTNKMVMITKINIPVNTITRLIIAVPKGGEFESGFGAWIYRIANILEQIGCKGIFFSHSDTLAKIEEELKRIRPNIRREYRTLDAFDQLSSLTEITNIDDLLIFVSARDKTISYSPDIKKLPNTISRHFADNNLAIIYPEQAINQEESGFYGDPHASNLTQDNAYIENVLYKIKDTLTKKN